MTSVGRRLLRSSIARDAGISRQELEPAPKPKNKVNGFTRNRTNKKNTEQRYMKLSSYELSGSQDISDKDLDNIIDTLLARSIEDLCNNTVIDNSLEFKYRNKSVNKNIESMRKKVCVDFNQESFKMCIRDEIKNSAENIEIPLDYAIEFEESMAMKRRISPLFCGTNFLPTDCAAQPIVSFIMNNQVENFILFIVDLYNNQSIKEGFYIERIGKIESDSLHFKCNPLHIAAALNAYKFLHDILFSIHDILKRLFKEKSDEYSFLFNQLIAGWLSDTLYNDPMYPFDVAAEQGNIECVNIFLSHEMLKSSSFIKTLKQFSRRTYYPYGPKVIDNLLCKLSYNNQLKSIPEHSLNVLLSIYDSNVHFQALFDAISTGSTQSVEILLSSQYLKRGRILDEPNNDTIGLVWCNHTVKPKEMVPIQHLAALFGNLEIITLLKNFIANIEWKRDGLGFTYLSFLLTQNNLSKLDRKVVLKHFSQLQNCPREEILLILHNIIIFKQFDLLHELLPVLLRQYNLKQILYKSLFAGSLNDLPLPLCSAICTNDIKMIETVVKIYLADRANRDRVLKEEDANRCAVIVQHKWLECTYTDRMALLLLISSVANINSNDWRNALNLLIMKGNKDPVGSFLLRYFEKGRTEYFPTWDSSLAKAKTIIYL